MLRTFTAAVLVVGSLSAVAAPTPGYFQVCAAPYILGAYLGPKLIDAKSTPDLLSTLTLIQGFHKAYTLESLKKLTVKDGVYASSPYVESDLLRQEKISKICVMFGTGGVALNVSDAIARNASLSDPEERKRAFFDAAEVSDEKCFLEAHKLEREKVER